MDPAEVAEIERVKRLGPGASTGKKITRRAKKEKLIGDTLALFDAIKRAEQSGEKVVGLNRKRVWRKTPKHIGGLVAAIFNESEATQVNAALDKTLKPTDIGTYRLFAAEVKLLYPDTPITPAKAPRYYDTVKETLKDAAFVFTHTYQHTDQRSIKQLDDLARAGVPVYSIVGEVTGKHPARKIWNAKREKGQGKVNHVFSAQESQGKGRQYRIDHSKDIFVVKKDGTVVVFKGGINQNELSHQNIDLGHMFVGGNMALDVLNNLVGHYLRAGGTIDSKDFGVVKKAIKKMTEAKRKKTSVDVETANTSSTLVGLGVELDMNGIVKHLSGERELVLSAKSFYKAMQADQSILTKFRAAAKRGKRIVISLDPDMVKDQAKAVEKVIKKGLEHDGIEVLPATAIYIDNSIENAQHKLIATAAQDGEAIWSGAFANSDGALAKRLVEASATLEVVTKGKKQVELLSADLDIEGRQINAGNVSRLLFSPEYRGGITGMKDIPGPKDKKGIGRKFHMKAIATETAYMLKSANDSAHGMGINEESGVVVYSSKLAKEVRKFMERAKREYGIQPKLDLERSGVAPQDRPSLTKRVVSRSTKLKDTVVLVMDYETDGFSRETDNRLSEVAAGVYQFDKNGKLEKITGLPKGLKPEFNRLINLGNDLFGRPKKMPKDIAEITNITDPMLKYQGDVVEVMNDFNAWVRAVEKATGKTVVFAGHNFTFDRRMYNQFSDAKGVKEAPYMDGDYIDSMSSLTKLRAPDNVKKLVPAAEALGVKLPSSGAAHRAGYDIDVTARLIEHQINRLLKDGVTFTVKGKKEMTIEPNKKPFSQVTWGDIRPLFISKEQLHKESKQDR
jgi:DNA polymerase III epsilon subunit-like protein